MKNTDRITPEDYLRSLTHDPFAPFMKSFEEAARPPRVHVAAVKAEPPIDLTALKATCEAQTKELKKLMALLQPTQKPPLERGLPAKYKVLP